MKRISRSPASIAALIPRFPMGISIEKRFLALIITHDIITTVINVMIVFFIVFNGGLLLFLKILNPRLIYKTALMKGRFKRKRFTCNGTGAVRSLTGAYCGVFYGASDKRVRGNAQKLWYIKLD